MKLLKKINFYFMFFSFLVFMLGSISTYLVLQALIDEEVRETLESEKKNILEQFKLTGLSQEYLQSGNMEIRRIPDMLSCEETFTDTVIFVSEEQETVPFRQLTFGARLNNKNYQIRLRRSLIEKDDLVLGITVMMMAIFVAMILLLNAINYWSDRRLWKPFYRALIKLETFNLNSRTALNLPAENIDEFNQLNKTLNNMAAKLQNDYHTLKEFSENAAHEMQTPLAVIRSKLDALIQDQTLSEEQIQTIHSLFHSVSRMARLNQSLNLLTKIENREFNEKQEVDFSTLIEQQLANLNELIQMSELKVEMELDKRFIKRFNVIMAETLLSNLLSNAIKHNLPGGFIKIKTSPGSITISNSGAPLQSNPQELFSRFKKDRSAPDSPGLGLSIVQSICQQNGLSVDYQCSQEKHQITITNS